MSKEEESFSKEEVESLARKLDEWSKGLRSGERALLQLLVARFGDHVPINEPEVIDTEKVRNSMKDATVAVLQRFTGADKQELK